MFNDFHWRYSSECWLCHTLLLFKISLGLLQQDNDAAKFLDTHHAKKNKACKMDMQSACHFFYNARKLDGPFL